MAVNAIVTRGYLFTPALIVTDGYLSRTVAMALGHAGSYPSQKKKKRKERLPSFIPLGPSARESMLAVLDGIQERQDEEDLLILMNQFDL